MFVKDFVGACVSHFRPLASQASRPAGFSGQCHGLHRSIHSGAHRSQRLSRQNQVYFPTNQSSLSSKLHYQEHAGIRLIQARMFSFQSEYMDDRYAKDNLNKSLKTAYDNNREVIRRMRNQLTAGDVPKLRDITSLPKIPSISGDESFVGLVIETNSTTTALIMLGASSEEEDFVCYVNPHERLNPGIERYLGAEYDSETDQLMMKGIALDTVTEEEALQDFADFLKRHTDPTLITFRGHYSLDRMLRFYRIARKYPSLLHDICSMAPVQLDAFDMARNVVPKRSTPNYSIGALCQNLLNRNMPTKDPISRANCISQLFSHYLLGRGADFFCRSSDYYHAKDTYIEMVVKDNWNLALTDKLAHDGVGLDHLMFLKQQGFDTFEKYLLERDIMQNDISFLYEKV